MLGNGSWISFDLLLKELDRSLELLVVTTECRVGQIIDDDVWFRTVSFDEPLAFRAVHAEFCSRGYAVVGFRVAEAQPYFPAPGAHADNFAEAKSLESFGESFAVGRR